MPSANFGDSRFRLDYSVSQIQQDVANNRSYIRRVLVMVRQGSSYAYSGSANSWSSSGPTSTSGGFTFNFGNYASLTLMDRYEWVAHNSDGTKSFASAASISADLPAGWDSASVSYTVYLTTIPRATTPKLPTGVTGLTTGVAQTIELPRAAAGFTHDVTWQLGTKSGTVATGAATTASVTLPHTVMTELPNAASGNVTFTTVTKSGSTVIGTVNTPFLLTAASSVVPTVTSVVWEDQNATVRTNIGAFVQGLSLVKGAVVASGAQGSTISTRGVVISGNTLPDNTVFQVDGSGTITASGVATDSRGRSASLAANFTVLPYEAPKIGANSWSVQRANSSNVADDNGQYLRIDLHAIAKSLKPSTVEKNALKISVRTRPTNGAWTNRNVINPGLTHNTSFQVSGGAAYLVSQSYEVEISLTDNTGISPIVLRTVIGTTIVTIDLRDNRVGIGKMHEQGALDVAGDVYGVDFYGNDMYSNGVKLARVDELETMPAGTIIAWPSPYPPINWLICDGAAVSRVVYSDLFAIVGSQFGPGNGSSTFNLPDLRGRVPVGYDSTQPEFNAIGKRDGAKTHKLSVAEMPSHSHTAVGSTGSTLAGSGGTPIFTVNTNTTTGASGGNAEHNNLQPYAVMNFIVKASGGIDELSSTVESVLLGRVASVEQKVNNKPSFQAKLTASHSRSGSTAWVKIPFNDILLNEGGNYNSSLSRFVAPIAGVYEFIGSINTTTTSGGPALSFYVNGSPSPQYQNLGYNNAYMSMTWTEKLSLAVGDYVEAWMANPNNTAITLGHTYGNYFSGALL